MENRRGKIMNRTKNNPNIWTEKRKVLCDEFWADCAQCECEVPCKRIIEAEKDANKAVIGIGQNTEK